MVTHSSVAFRVAAWLLAVACGGVLALFFSIRWLGLAGRRVPALAPAAPHAEAWRVDLFPWD